MADAYLMVCYASTHPICYTDWFESGSEKEEKEEEKENEIEDTKSTSLLTPSMIAFFESFRYHPRPDSRRWDTFRLSSLMQSDPSE